LDSLFDKIKRSGSLAIRTNPIRNILMYLHMFLNSTMYRCWSSTSHSFLYTPWFDDNSSNILRIWSRLACYGIVLVCSVSRGILSSGCIPGRCMCHCVAVFGTLQEDFLRALSCRLPVIISPLLHTL